MKSIIRHSMIIYLIFCLFYPVWAQMETPPPCIQIANTDWYALAETKPGDTIDTWISHHYWDSWKHTTSILPAEGKPPQKPYKSYEGLSNEEIEEYVQWEKKYSEWSCMYGPECVIDGDSSTAWCEGVDGLGIGEVIVVYIGNAQQIGIWPGFGKSDRLFQLNGRPRILRLHILQAIHQSPTQMDVNIGPFTKLAESVIQLSDRNAMQIVHLPKYSLLEKKEEAEYVEVLNPVYLALEIVDVYPGTKYQDTLITEINPIE